MSQRFFVISPMVLRAGLVLAVFALFSCATKPIEIPAALSAAEMIQRAQEASDRNQYEVSLQYYQAILERFPNDDSSLRAAEYEIAFIHYNQKKYDLAKDEFNTLLERYNSPDQELLPPQYKVLAVKLLETIAAIESKNTKTPAPTGEGSPPTP